MASFSPNIYRKIKRGIVEAANLIGMPAEYAISAKIGDSPMSPIFIVGQSRSGTTLCYQLLTSYLEASYFSNFSCLFYKIPLTCALLSKPFGGCKPRPSTKNSYGITDGWNQPNTGYPIWNRWFRRIDGKMDVRSISPRAYREMKHTIGAVSNLYDAPFVNKWTPNSARIMELNKAFPEALFIHILRDKAQIAQSILLAREKITGNAFDTFVTWPEGFLSDNRSDHVSNICQHIALVENEISRCKRMIGRTSFLTVEYEKLCADPRRELNRIRNSYKNRCGQDLNWRNKAHIPQKLVASAGIRIDREEYKRMEDKLSDL